MTWTRYSPSLHVLIAIVIIVCLVALNIQEACAQVGAYVDLHDFGGVIANGNAATAPDGQNPYAGVTFDQAGNIFGTTYNGGVYTGIWSHGMLWEITAGGVYKDVHDFGGTTTTTAVTTGPDATGP